MSRISWRLSVREDMLDCVKCFIKDKARLSSFRAVSCPNAIHWSLVGVSDHSVDKWKNMKF